jgi:hypothetical protein
LSLTCISHSDISHLDISSNDLQKDQYAPGFTEEED